MRTILAYCSGVCGAKCCKGNDFKCGYLSADCLCSIYEKRFAPDMPDTVTIGAYRKGEKLLAYSCTRIERLIKAGKLDKTIEAGCCIAHPELLED